MGACHQDAEIRPINGGAGGKAAEHVVDEDGRRR